ncbi:MAG TPA: hypothetical protein VML75_18960 [Kofleriaceae bacterium]|nr:hypothetical protein [Kofleriaceae bacterium]
MKTPIAVIALLLGATSWSCSGNSKSNNRVERAPIAQANGHYADAGTPYLSKIDGGATPFIEGGSDGGAEWDQGLPTEEIPPGEMPESDPYDAPAPGDPTQPGEPPQPGDPLDPSSPTPGSPDPLEPIDPAPSDPISPEPGQPAPPPTGPDLPY